MSRETVAAADTILEKPFPCLNHGFVRLIDYMGSDASIVQAARVSYGQGTKRLREDRNLIRYLMRHHHTTPFEMVEFKFHCKMPIFVARQWIRHRTASVNEYSLRYSRALDEFYLPEPGSLQMQSQQNRQGRDAATVPTAVQTQVLEILKRGVHQSWQDYEALEQAGLARELARINLPLSLYTEWYWKIDLHNLLHFLSLRLEEHAQYEIRVYAEALAQIIQTVVPITWEAYKNYILQAQTFSHSELAFLSHRLQPHLSQIDWQQLARPSEFSVGEWQEFLAKIQAWRQLATGDAPDTAAND
ncbi:FAD-dependent thymidylate synthase [candidate division KSB1 bacterium]|nr:FAD-dependent thymidylate synthase [candidate division KSB1 bacterium]